MENPKPYFSHRSCYVNFAEHLQNAWNVNMLYPGAPNRWTCEDWRGFLTMIKSFGFNCFEYWLVPTLFHPSAFENSGIHGEFAVSIRAVNEMAHELGLRTKLICAVNTIGAEWFFACPNDPEQKDLIFSLWRHWMRELSGTDIIGIFPGDPGGCNRNGCTHETYVDLALELSRMILTENAAAQVEIGTWGTPFTGWGTDLWNAPDWDGSWKMLNDEKHSSPETPCHIWNGGQPRAQAAMEYLLKRLPDFPNGTTVAINLGFSPDCDATMGGDARAWAREVAKTNPITSWDYSVAEGELINYPHWRLPRMSSRRREERAAAPYSGGMSYTMTPKLNLLNMFAAGEFFANPDADPDLVSRKFASLVFGEEHAVLGELFEAFEVVQGWGYYPRRQWSRAALLKAYGEIIDRLESADVSRCRLPLFPGPQTYRQDLLWFAHKFREMAGTAPDREAIRKDYWARALSIYDTIPMSADKRAEAAARQFSDILSQLP